MQPGPICGDERAPVVTALDLDLDAWTAAAGLTDGGR